MEEAAREFRDLIGSRKPTDAEIRFARDNLVLALPGNNETSGEVVRSYADIITFGLPDTYVNEFVGKVGVLTPAQLQTAADDLVHPDALTWIVVGDLTAIEAKVRKLGLGEVKVLDTDGKVLP
jgi:zinc protease